MPDLLQVDVLLVRKERKLLPVVILPLLVLVPEEHDRLEYRLRRGQLLREAVLHQMVEVIVAEGYYTILVTVDLLGIQDLALVLPVRFDLYPFDVVLLTLEAEWDAKYIF
jgi:hypothetical protein